MQRLIRLYQTLFQTEPLSVEPIKQAGSSRQYFRLFHSHEVESREGTASVVGVVGTSQKENEAFFYLTEHFEQVSLPVPHLLGISEDRLCYLQTDLGKASLFSLLKTVQENGEACDPELIRTLEATISYLPLLQVKGKEDLLTEKLIPPTGFNRQTILFDLNYFKYCFLKTTGIDFDEVALQKDMQAFAENIAAWGERYSFFLYRDFQARNVMVCNGKPFFIDYQSGRIGPPAYDVASFLWQAAARYSPELRNHLIDIYVEKLQSLVPIEKEEFLLQLRQMVFFRTLQVLAAYGLRGRFERKQHFLESIPPALKNLHDVLEEGVADNFPYLKQTLKNLIEAENLSEQAVTAEKPQATAATAENTSFAKNDAEDKRLVVRVFSFSYKKGIPEDESGNGGGYVFDCRAPHNPGRYEAYKKLTGLDRPVIDFLESEGERSEIVKFLEKIYYLADFHVQRYIDRGFTALMFSFGCTGGQHRSVYCAQHLAEHLHKKFGIEVRLHHREQDIHTVLPARKDKD